MDELPKRTAREPEPNEFTLHALEFHWHGFEPHLECYDVQEGEECELDLEDVDFVVSGGKTCIGSWDDKGNYRPCPNHIAVTKFSQCDQCSEEFYIPDQECVFDPKCDGTDCLKVHREWGFCKREHVLYFAFYDTLVKVGMSSSRRVDKRLIEQGADAYSIIGSFPNRFSAREKEKDISRELGIPEFYRQKTILDNMSKPVDEAGIEREFADKSQDLGRLFQLKPGPLVWLSDYPIELPLRQAPVLEPSPGRHSGTKIGVKGKWIVYERDGLRALSLADLPARFLARHVA